MSRTMPLLLLLLVAAEVGCTADTWWCDGSGCDVSRWALLYEHDAKGEAVYGRREDLLTALRDGGTVGVYVPRFRYAVPAEHVHVEDGHVCAQFWKNACIASWMSFKRDVYWWMLMLCTSGYGQASRYYVGGKFRSRNDYSLAVQWYVKYPYSLRRVLTLKAGGWIESGNFGVLQQAVLAGKAIYALMGDDVKGDLLRLTSVAIKRFDVVAQSTNRVSMKPCKDGRCEFEDKALWLSYFFTTASGNVVTSRRVVDYPNRLIDLPKDVSVTWLVDDCWSLALTHDGSGKVTQGCLECLRDAVRAGHRVRVRLPGLDNLVAEADGLIIKKGVLTGYFLSFISDDENPLPDVAAEHATHAVWMTISTSGVVRMRRQKLGSTIAGNGTVIAFYSVMWYIDTRPWHLTLSVDKEGTVTGGSKLALTEAVKRGATVRYAIKYPGDAVKVVGVHNMHVHGSDVSAENTLAIRLKAAAGNSADFDFPKTPYWYFTIMTTTGRLETSRWRYGEHKSRSRVIKHFAVDWFVLY